MSTSSVKHIPNLTHIMVGGLLATVVVTITMLISGTDIAKGLGIMLIGGNASETAQYGAGGVMHLAVGIAYSALYAFLFSPVTEWNRLIKGIIFGVFVTAIALSFMPMMASMLAGDAKSASNPCAAQAHNPCSTKMSNACNPCSAMHKNPCASTMHNACNPCGMKASNPCNMNASKSWGENPCSQRVIKMSKPNQQHMAANSSNPCAASNPCGSGAMSGNSYAALISLINHIFFGLTLAFFIRRPEQARKIRQG